MDIVIRFINYIKEKLMGRPRKTLTTLETSTPEQVVEINTGEKDLYSTPVNEKLDALIAETQKLGLYDEVCLGGFVELKNTALSIVRNPVTQHWILLQFKFDYATKTIGEMTIVEEHTDRIEIVERFKMVAGTELMSAV
jgi:hypothetical protein